MLKLVRQWSLIKLGAWSCCILNVDSTILGGIVLIKRLLAITLTLLLVLGTVSVAFAADPTIEETEDVVRALELKVQIGIRSAIKAEKIWNACDEADWLIFSLPQGIARNNLFLRVWIIRLMASGYWARFRIQSPPDPPNGTIT